MTYPGQSNARRAGCSATRTQSKPTEDDNMKQPTKQKQYPTPTTRAIWLTALCLMVLVSWGCAPRLYAPADTTTQVVLIRHAERTAITKELTPGGHQRAAALPAAVEDLNIVAIYSPDLSRNIDTVKPLAETLGLDITIAAESAKIDLDQVAGRLVNDHPGKTVLWVGNKGNLVRLYSALGGTDEAPLEYGELFIMHVPDQGATRVEKRRFGNRYFN